MTAESARGIQVATKQQRAATEGMAGALAEMICNQIYDTALMAQKGFDADGMKAFVERSNKLLTKLTER